MSLLRILSDVGGIAVKEIYVAIDLGTSKTCVVIGRCDARGWVEILGKGITNHEGIKKGIIVDIDEIAGSIEGALREAEREASLSVRSAYININCMHAVLSTYDCKINIHNSTGTVTSREIDALMEQLYSIKLDADKQVIDVIPIEYKIDNYDGIVDPRGMAAKELSIFANVVFGDTMYVNSLYTALKKVGLKCDGIIFEPLAQGDVVLSEDDKENGALMIDVGSCVTDISFFDKNELQFESSILVGGWQITNDLSYCLNVSYEESEKIKRKYELALSDLIQNDQDIYVKDKSTNQRKSVKVSDAVQIIEARVNEIFRICREVVEQSGKLGDVRKVVLIGAGIYFMDGAPQMASHVFNLPTKLGSWKEIGHNNPEDGMAISMIYHIKKSRAKKVDLSSEILTEDDLISIPKEGWEEFERRIIVVKKKIQKWFKWMLRNLF